jgi:hypothetical protein
MIDLSTISDEVRLARGDYSTVRAAHEDAKKDLQKLCGQLSATAPQILRKMQPDDDEVPDSVGSLIESARLTLTMIEACVANIESLAKQRQELKQKAWGR